MKRGDLSNFIEDSGHGNDQFNVRVSKKKKKKKGSVYIEVYRSSSHDLSLTDSKQRVV